MGSSFLILQTKRRWLLFKTWHGDPSKQQRNVHFQQPGSNHIQH